MWPVYLHAEYEGLQGSPGASLPSRSFVTGRHGVPSLDARVPRVALVCARLVQEPREIPLVCGRRMPGLTIHVDTTGDDWAVPSEVVPLPLALRQCWCAPRRVSVVLAGRARRLVAGPLDGSGSDLCRVPEGRDVARKKVHLIMAGGDISWAGTEYVSVAERPDPEVVRVNDLDGEFEQIYVACCS